MRCPECGFETGFDVCPNCKTDLNVQKKACLISDRLYNAALERAQINDLSGAAEMLERALEYSKHNIEARNLLGLVYGSLGRHFDALRQWVISFNFKKTENIAADYIDSLKKNYRTLEKYNEAIKLYNKALGDLKIKSDDIALIKLRRATDIHPGFVDALNLLALCYMSQGQPDKALETVNLVLDTDCRNFKALKYLSELQPAAHRVKHYDKISSYGAETLIAKDTQHKTFNPKYARNLNAAFSFKFSHAVFFAVGALLVCIIYSLYVVPPKQDVIDKNRTEIERLTNEMSSNDALRQAEITAKQSEIDSLKAQIADLNADIVNLDADLHRADTMQRINYAKGLVNEQKYEEAVSYIEGLSTEGLPEEYAALIAEIKATAYPKLEAAFYNMGISEYNRKNYDEAIVLLEKSVLYSNEASQTADDSLYFIGRSYENKSDIPSARKYFERVVNDYPASNQAGNAKSKLQTLPSN